MDRSPSRRAVALRCALALLLTALALTPLAFPGAFAAPPAPGSLAARAARVAVDLLPLLVIGLAFRMDLGLPRAQKATLLLLLVVLALLLVELHVCLVDDGRYFPSMSNRKWQLMLHKQVLALDPAGLPHSYRFLPNGVVALLQVGTGDFASASLRYRHVFTFLLLLATYCWSRRHLQHPTALVPLFLYCAIYPISVRYYAGQLTDPLSHLSFVLGLLFLETGPFAYLLLTVLIGILAKESIVLVGACYALFHFRERGYAYKLAALVLGAVAIGLSVRLAVSGLDSYTKISGVGTDWMSINLANEHWQSQLAYTVGIFVPFVVLAWRQAPWSLKGPLLVLLPGLLVTNVLFSAMREARNLVPATLVMAVMTVHHLFPAGRVDARGAPGASA